MTFDQRARSASVAVREARSQAIFTSEAPSIRSRNRQSTRRGLAWALVGAVVTSVIFGSGLLLTTYTPDLAPVDSASVASPDSPLATSIFDSEPPPGALTNAPSLDEWRQIVSLNMGLAGLQYEGLDLEVWETPESLEEGGSMSAVVDHPSAGRRFVIDFQAFAQGEYRTDPDWIAEVAGSREWGEVLPAGTIFETGGGDRRTTILVMSTGVLYVGAQGGDAFKLPSSATLREFALLVSDELVAETNP